MRKKRMALALALLPLLGLTGCKETFDFLPYARELEDMALIRTMGVDAGGSGGVVVTVSSGEQSKGSGQGDSGAVVLQKEAGTISGACLSMQGEGVSYVFYGHVGQLLLGEELARQGVEMPLDYVLRDIEMRLETNVYLLKDAEAGEAIAAAAEGGSATKRLEAMEKDAGLLSHSMARTVEDALEDLEENQCTFLPALTLAGEEMTASGYGLIRDGKLAGWAQGEDAKGVNLLLGEVDADILEVDDPVLGRVALRIVEAETKVEPVFQDGSFTGLTIRCRVEANLAEGGGEAAGLGHDEERERLEQALEERSAERLRGALSLSQSLAGDFFQLKNRAERSAPWHRRAIEVGWDLSALDLEVQVEGALRRGYDLRSE